MTTSASTPRSLPPRQRRAWLPAETVITPLSALLGGERPDPVERASRLERARLLEQLRLQIPAGAEAARSVNVGVRCTAPSMTSAARRTSSGVTGASGTVRSYGPDR